MDEIENGENDTLCKSFFFILLPIFGIFISPYMNLRVGMEVLFGPGWCGF